MSEDKKEKTKMALWKKIAIVVVGLGIIGAIFGKSDDKSTSSSSSSKSSTAKSITIPSDQQKFIDVVESFYKPYRDAGDNQLKKSRERKNRKKKLKETMKSMSFKNWIGKIDTLGTTGDGNGYIEIDPYKSDFSIQTWNNDLSDIGSNTTIKDGTKVYDQMIELKEGDLVSVSGSFLSGDEDYIDEQSMGEDGAMTDPEFTIKISSITKYVKK
jgi:hypothetical protein